MKPLPQFPLSQEQFARLFGILKRKFGSLDAADVEECLNWAVWKVWSHPEPAIDFGAAALHRAFHLCLDERDRQVREFDRFRPLTDDHANQVTPNGPDEISDRHRRARQELLLTDILKGLRRDCEQSGKLKLKEVFERSLYSQPSGDIARVMGLNTSNGVSELLRQARERLLKLAELHDTGRSVFLTLWRAQDSQGKHRPRLLIPPRPPARDGVPSTNFIDVFWAVIRESPALCPSSKRLAAYRNDPTSVQFTDIVFHIKAGPCGFCQEFLHE